MTTPRPFANHYLDNLRPERNSRLEYFMRMRALWITLRTMDDPFDDLMPALTTRFGEVQGDASELGYITSDAEDYFDWGGPAPRPGRKLPVIMAECNYCGTTFLPEESRLRMCDDDHCPGVASAATMRPATPSDLAALRRARMTPPARGAQTRARNRAAASTRP